VLRFSLTNLKRRLLATATAVSVVFAGAVYAQSTDPLTADDLMWLYIQQLGSADAYAAYLIEFPNGKFAEAARGSLTDMAARGIVPSGNIEGIEVAGLPEGEALADLLNGDTAADMSRFFFIEYAG